LHPYGVAHLSSGERAKENAKTVTKKVHSHLALALCKPGEKPIGLRACANRRVAYVSKSAKKVV